MIAALKSLTVNPELSGPLSQDHGFPVCRYCYAIPLVFVLMHTLFPGTVMGRVWAIVIKTLDRVLLARPESHIINEVLKRILPAVAYSYTSAAVVFVCRIVFVKAPRLNSTPDCIFRYFYSFCVSMLESSITRPGVIPVQASTRACMPRLQLIIPDNNDISAVTPALPHGSFFTGCRDFFVGSGENDEPCEARENHCVYIHESNISHILA